MKGYTYNYFCIAKKDKRSLHTSALSEVLGSISGEPSGSIRTGSGSDCESFHASNTGKCWSMAKGVMSKLTR